MEGTASGTQSGYCNRLVQCERGMTYRLVESVCPIPESHVVGQLYSDKNVRVHDQQCSCLRKAQKGGNAFNLPQKKDNNNGNCNLAVTVVMIYVY